MGAKTWMLVYSEGDTRQLLASNPQLDRSETDRVAAKLFTKEKLEPLTDGCLTSACPPNNELLIGCFPGITIVAAKEFAIDRPSKLEARFVQHAGKGNLYLHAMHSVVDWFAYAVWQQGELKRSLSVAPDNGVIEDIGETLPFELPFWAGEHPAVDPEDQDEDEPPPYPFPFHPLEFGEAALKEFFGYQLEGYADPTLLDSDSIALARYKRRKSLFNPW
jgi:hypothetical protein